MKSLPGARLPVPIVATPPDDSITGAKLASVADTTAGTDSGRPSRLALFVTLAGGTSTELVLYVRDAVLGWARCADTGNFGLLSGGKIPSGATYVFMVSGIAIFKEFLLLQQNDLGGAVVVSEANLVSYVDKMQTIP